jgi:hypothetical protein
MYEHLFLICPLTDKIQAFRCNNSEILSQKKEGGGGGGSLKHKMECTLMVYINIQVNSKDLPPENCILWKHVICWSINTLYFMILYSWPEFLLSNQRSGGEWNLTKKWDNHAPPKLRQNLQAFYSLIIRQLAQNLKGNRFLFYVLLPIYDLDSYCATLNTDGWVRNHDPRTILLDSCNKSH